jgi:hypothetical protein
MHHIRQLFNDECICMVRKLAWAENGPIQGATNLRVCDCVRHRSTAASRERASRQAWCKVKSDLAPARIRHKPIIDWIVLLGIWQEIT